MRGTIIRFLHSDPSCKYSAFSCHLSPPSIGSCSLRRVYAKALATAWCSARQFLLSQPTFPRNVLWPWHSQRPVVQREESYFLWWPNSYFPKSASAGQLGPWASSSCLTRPSLCPLPECACLHARWAPLLNGAPSRSHHTRYSASECSSTSGRSTSPISM
ncbi:hypothetical protein MPH_09976 [Macrophomina phaseolina MS6]|uniref:Uncharacterized protein n=1 Tax=Macrophomina phaseolina (strain MS6) TaxID=1126212 RepID=K2RJ16_MACPH|nr:hypothetical protein MPH_09976 [Macrophomina phaseolina MS6]